MSIIRAVLISMSIEEMMADVCIIRRPATLLLLRHCPIATMQSVVTKQAALSLEWNVASKGEHKKTGGGFTHTAAH